MLGKTAGGLTWMFRYLERSESTARLVGAGSRIALTRRNPDDEWVSVLETTATRRAYDRKYDEVTRDRVVDWLLRDLDNPSSVQSSVIAARNNARMVRTALTREVWESLNESWMLLREALASPIAERDLPERLTLIRQRSAHVRGAFEGTMLRNDIYNFARLGTYLERADNTARLLDVKYYVLLPSAQAVGSSLDNVQWESILRTVAAEGGFRMTFGQDLRAANIAQFLILDTRMPRSLAFSVGKLTQNLKRIEIDYGERKPCHDLADGLKRVFLTPSIDDVFERGLHEYIQDFLIECAALGSQIETDYRFYE